MNFLSHTPDFLIERVQACDDFTLSCTAKCNLDVPYDHYSVPINRILRDNKKINSLFSGSLFAGRSGLARMGISIYPQIQYESPIWYEHHALYGNFIIHFTRSAFRDVIQSAEFLHAFQPGIAIGSMHYIKQEEKMNYDQVSQCVDQQTILAPPNSTITQEGNLRIPLVNALMISANEYWSIDVFNKYLQNQLTRAELSQCFSYNQIQKPLPSESTGIYQISPLSHMGYRSIINSAGLGSLHLSARCNGIETGKANFENDPSGYALEFLNQNMDPLDIQGNYIELQLYQSIE